MKKFILLIFNKVFLIYYILLLLKYKLMYYIKYSSNLKFYKKYLYFEHKTSKILGKEVPKIDPYILQRKPVLKFDKEGNVIIDNIYFEKDETITDFYKYTNYVECLDDVLNLEQINSFADIGCRNGSFLKYIKKKYKNIELFGLDYFDFHLKKTDQIIRECIEINDISKPVNFKKKYDIVNCTEVAEHIQPKNIDFFLENLKNCCNKYLVISWSSTYPARSDAPPQHLCPLEKEDVLKLINNKDFIFLKNDTLRLKKLLKHKGKKVNSWWGESILIFQLNKTDLKK